MLFRETVVVYCESNTKYISALCGQNAEFVSFKAGGICRNHSALKGQRSSLYQLEVVYYVSKLAYTIYDAGFTRKLWRRLGIKIQNKTLYTAAEISLEVCHYQIMT
jgi:hypothetical protein